MKICFFSPLYEPWNVGGIENYVKTLVNHLIKKHEVVIVTTAGPKPRKKELNNQTPKIREIKSNVVSLYNLTTNDPPLNSIQKKLWYLFDIWSLTSFSKIKNILDEEKPDIIHTNGVMGFSASLFSAIKKSKIPLVHTLHNYDLLSRWSSLTRNNQPISHFNFFDNLYVTYMRRMSNNIDAVISPSQFLMDLLTKYDYFKKSKKFIIQHGMTIKKNVKSKEGIGREFLFFGRIERIKGLSTAIEAIKKINEKCVLHVVGKGPFLDSVKKIAGNDERIIFHGFVSNDQLNGLLKNCSYSIVPSIWYEPFGLVIIESLNFGLPVIGSKIGAIPELIQDGYNGKLFEAGNVNSLVRIINKLISDEKTLGVLSKNAIESSKNFEIEKQVRDTVDVYNSLLS